MKGQYLEFIKIENDNKMHYNILKEIANSTPYLGNLEHYTNNDNERGGYNYLVKNRERIIGYVGLSGIIDTPIGKTVSIYYAILKEYYGKGYGKLIVNEIALILKKQNNVDLIIANVDNTNIHGLKTIKSANFKQIPELSDEEETQFHKKLR